jgi:hypothetical protein
MKPASKFSDTINWQVYCIASLFMLTTASCKHDAPKLSTEPVTNITTTTAVSGGKVTDDDNSNVTVRGVCWNTTPNPTLENCINKTSDGAGFGTFSSNITGVTEGDTYYVAAYATNQGGTGYGQVESFATKKCPSVTATPVSNVGLNSVTLNGTVNANDESTTVTFEYGTSTSYGNTIAAAQSPVTGTTTTNVSALISTLTTNTLYHFRINAVSSICTKTTADQTFTTGQCPTATTSTASDLDLNSATFNGVVNANGLSTVVTFEYGKDINYGTVTTASQSPVSGNSNSNVSLTA